MKQPSKRLTPVQWCVLIILLYVAAVLLFPHRINCVYANGDSVSIWEPSFLGAVASGTCIVQISSESGKCATVRLREGCFDLPLVVVPSANKDVFYCIYDHDVDFLIVKIDLGRGFSPPPKDGPLSENILPSSCAVARVRNFDTNNWVPAVAALEAMPPDQFNRQVIGGLRLGFCHLHTAQQVAVDELRNYGSQGGYNGDTVIPTYSASVNSTNEP